MNTNSDDKNLNEAEIKKQNEDLPNLPAASEKIDSTETAKKQIKKTSKIQDEGKMDNTEKNSEN